MAQSAPSFSFEMPKNVMTDLTFFGDVDGTSWIPFFPRLDYKESRAILPRLVDKTKITTAILKNTRLYGYKTEVEILVALPIQCVRVSPKMNTLDIVVLCEALAHPTSVIEQVVFEGEIDAFAHKKIQAMTDKKSIKVTFMDIGTSK
jgi:hypothetical protein